MQDLRKLVGMVVPKKFAFDKIILFIADFDKKSKRFYIK